MLTSILKTTIPDISPRATIKWVSKACEFLILESLVIKMLKILDLLEGALFLICLKTKEDTQYHQIVMLIYLRAFFSLFLCVVFGHLCVDKISTNIVSTLSNFYYRSS